MVHRHSDDIGMLSKRPAHKAPFSMSLRSGGAMFLGGAFI